MEIQKNNQQTHPKYAEMKLWSIDKIQAHIKDCPGTRDGRCIPGHNALEMVQHNQKSQRAMIRLGKSEATINGLTHVRRKGKCPSKRDLK